MSRVSELIDLIVQGKNTEATEVLNNELMNRSYEGINDIKPAVANDYFASVIDMPNNCLLYTSPSPRDGLLSRMPSSA